MEVKGVLLFCGSWDLGQLSFCCPPPPFFFFFFLPLHPAPCWRPAASPEALHQRKGFITTLFIFNFSANTWRNSHGCSLGYPRFLLLLLLPVALVCPYMSTEITGRGVLNSRSVIVAGVINIFGTNWGTWSQSMASAAHTLSDKQYSSVQQTRKPQQKGESPPLFCLTRSDSS